MSKNSDIFDGWIRSTFVELNTELEELYFAQADRSAVEGVGDAVKENMRAEGRKLLVPLLEEGNTDEGFDNAYNLLGNVGLFFAALRRHEVTNPAREIASPLAEESALAMHLSASLGVVPRVISSHLNAYGKARDGVLKNFTSLPDETLFNEYNTRGVLCYMRAADALKRILPLGVSHPASGMLFDNACDALRDVIRYNKTLFDRLDPDRFFYCVRPYYKPYRVGDIEYRGMNAGDFSAINEIDLLLGLCQANDPFYAHILVDKMLFMTPDDQVRLRDTMRRGSLMNRFLEHADRNGSEPWFRENVSKFLETCKLHGAAAQQHHNMLVEKYIKAPSANLDPSKLTQITASGPPLSAMLTHLETIRDLRLAEKRDDLPTRHKDVQRLASLAQGA